MIKHYWIFKSIIGFLCCLIFFNAFAQAKKIPNKKDNPNNHHLHDELPPIIIIHPWEGTRALVGVTVNTGNTETTHLHSEIDVIYNKPRWGNIFQFKSQFGKDSGVVNKEKYFFQNQVNYNFLGRHRPDLRNYIFLSANLTVDKFSPYSYQSVTAIGYGRDLIKTESFFLSAQAGPGYRRNEVRVDNETDNGIVLTTEIQARWRISSYGEFVEEFRYDFGSPFNYLKSYTAYVNKLIGHFSVEVSYTVEHYSSIPPGSKNRKKTDTTTHISLVYNF